jgi:hypothetical protein
MSDEIRKGETGTNFLWDDGRLTPFEPPAELAWRENEDDTEYFRRIGFVHDHWANLRHPDEDVDGHTLRFLRRKVPGQGPQFIGILGSFEGWRLVWLRTFDDVVRLAALVAPLVAADHMMHALHEIERTSKRILRVTHERDHAEAWQGCDECDPQVARENRERLAEAARRKQSKG